MMQLLLLFFTFYNFVITSSFVIYKSSSSLTNLHSSTSSSSSSSSLPSLEKPILKLARMSLKHLPLKVINLLSLVLRKLLKWQLNNDQYDIRTCSFNANIDVIEYKSSNISNNIDNNNCIVYINGGGFSLCDSADLLLCSCLLPLLSERMKPPVIYSIHYTTSNNNNNNNDISNYDIVKSQIYDSYNSILNNSNKNIIGIMGDSAGGNLVLQLLSQLHQSTDCHHHHHHHHHPPKAVLISPWLDLFSNADSYKRYQYDDLLESSWLQRSRDLYLGHHSSFIETEIKKYQADLYADHLINNTNINTIVFDMDQTMVGMHSRGMLPRCLLQSFIDKTSNDFIYFAKALHKRGVNLAVATHSDSKEYSILKNKKLFIIGEELVRAVLNQTVPEIADFFHIVAYNPTLRNDVNVNNQNKRLHVRLISQHYDILEENVLLFDDDEGNVNNNNNTFKTLLVNWQKGFQLSDVRSFLSSSSSLNTIKHDSKLLSSLPQIVSDVNPGLKNDEKLKELKMMIVVGEKELFYDDIMEFIERTTTTNVFIGKNEIHAFPILWMHPLQKISLALGLGRSMFDFLLPHRKNTLFSEQPFEAMKEIANFLSC